MSAQTPVSGVISSDTTWSLSNSPYIVTGNILIQSGATLTIEPGVTVKLDSVKVIHISNGTFISKGTDQNPITFTTSNPTPDRGEWGYILFDDQSSDATFDSNGNYTGGSILEYTIVEYGGRIGDEGTIWISSSHPFINHCIIRHNGNTGIAAGGISKHLIITNSIIEDNLSKPVGQPWTTADGGGILVIGDSITICYNLIRDNSTSRSLFSSKGGGIYAGGKTSIYGNIIENNLGRGGAIVGRALAGGGIFVNNISVIRDNIIRNNTGFGDGGGIAVDQNTNATILNNEIISNSGGPRGGGIALGHWSSPLQNVRVLIKNNTINNNNTGVGGVPYGGGGISIAKGNEMVVTIEENYISHNSAPHVSALLCGGSNIEIRHNTFFQNVATEPANTRTVEIIDVLPEFNFNNFIDNTSTFELWNNNPVGSTNLNAWVNWWDSVVESEIQDKIYDFFDDGTLGIVEYQPYLLAPDTTAPIVGIKDDIINNPVKFLLHQNYPNPFNPTTTISYNLTTLYHVELIVFNLLGQKIRSLVNAKQPTGTYYIQWNGRDDQDEKVSSGIYLYRLQVGKYYETKKMVLLQ